MPNKFAYTLFNFKFTFKYLFKYACTFKYACIFYLKVFEISNLEWCVKNHVDHPQVIFLDNAGQQEFI